MEIFQLGSHAQYKLNVFLNNKNLTAMNANVGVKTNE